MRVRARVGARARRLLEDGDPPTEPGVVEFALFDPLLQSVKVPVHLGEAGVRAHLGLGLDVCRDPLSPLRLADPLPAVEFLRSGRG